MFFRFLISALCAAAFVHLGALSVWVSVLSLALKTLVLSGCGVLLYLWRSRRNP